MAIQTTSCQQPIEIREMSKDLQIYFNGLARGIRRPDTLMQYLAIGYYYKKLPRYTMLDYLRSCLGNSWLKTATDMARLVAEGKSFVAFDGPKDVYIPYSALAEEILMVLDVIKAYEQKAGVTIDEVTTVNQFDSYYSDFTKFISQYTTQATGLRTRAPVDSHSVVNRFIELGLINDSYKNQKTPQKKEITMEEDTSYSEESSEEPDVNENEESVQKPLVETLAGKVKKVIKKGKKTRHTRTIDKREVKEEKEKQKQISVRERKERERKKKDIENTSGQYIFDRTQKGLRTELEESRRIYAVDKMYKDLYAVVKNLQPVIEQLKAEHPAVPWLLITEKDLEEITTRSTERAMPAILNENELQPFLTGERHGLPDYQVGWFNIGGTQCLMLRTGIKTYKGEDVCYKIAEYLPNQ